MTYRTFLVAGVFSILIRTGLTQSVGLQASLLDPLYGAGHVEVSLQPISALTVDVAYGRRYGQRLGFWFSTTRHVGSIADLAVMYSADTDPRSSAHLLQVGPYWQRKRFTEVIRESVGFVFPSTVETQAAVDVMILGVRAGYKYISPRGLTTSVHLGAGTVTSGGTQLVSTTSRGITAASVEEGQARIHFQLRLKLGYTFRWPRGASR